MSHIVSGARGFVIVVFVNAGNCVRALALVEDRSVLGTWAVHIASGESHDETLLRFRGRHGFCVVIVGGGGANSCKGSRGFFISAGVGSCGGSRGCWTAASSSSLLSVSEEWSRGDSKPSSKNTTPLDSTITFFSGSQTL